MHENALSLLESVLVRRQEDRGLQLSFFHQGEYIALSVSHSLLLYLKDKS